MEEVEERGMNIAQKDRVCTGVKETERFGWKECQAKADVIRWKGVRTEAVYTSTGRQQRRKKRNSLVEGRRLLVLKGSWERG